MTVSSKEKLLTYLETAANIADKPDDGVAFVRVEELRTAIELLRAALEPLPVTEVLAAAERVAQELRINDADEDDRDSHTDFGKDLRTLIEFARSTQPPRAPQELRYGPGIVAKLERELAEARRDLVVALAQKTKAMSRMSDAVERASQPPPAECDHKWVGREGWEALHCAKCPATKQVPVGYDEGGRRKGTSPLTADNLADRIAGRSALPPGAWQPIETAPPTSRHNPVYVAYPHYKPENKTMEPDFYSCFTAYKDNLGWDTGFWRLHEDPHFWHPLPSAPTPTKGGE